MVEFSVLYIRRFKNAYNTDNFIYNTVLTIVYSYNKTEPKVFINIFFELAFKYERLKETISLHLLSNRLPLPLKRN